MATYTNPRPAYGETLVELGKADPRIVVLDADLCKSTMSVLFQDAFPDRYFEMGIAEAKRRAGELVGMALDALSGFGEKADPLREIAKYIVYRKS